MPLLVVSTSPSPGGVPFDFQGNPAEPTPLCRGYRRALHLSSGRVGGEVAACTRAVLGPRTLRSGPPLRDGLTGRMATVHPPEPTRSGIRTLTAFPPPKDTASPGQGSPLLTPAPVSGPAVVNAGSGRRTGRPIPSAPQYQSFSGALLSPLLGHLGSVQHHTRPLLKLCLRKQRRAFQTLGNVPSHVTSA